MPVPPGRELGKGCAGCQLQNALRVESAARDAAGCVDACNTINTQESCRPHRKLVVGGAKLWHRPGSRQPLLPQLVAHHSEPGHQHQPQQAPQPLAQQLPAGGEAAPKHQRAKYSQEPEATQRCTVSDGRRSLQKTSRRLAGHCECIQAADTS